MSELTNVKNELSIDTFTDDRKQKVYGLVSKLNSDDANSIIEFGDFEESALTKQSNMMIDNVKADKAGEVGASITNLLDELKDLDTDTLTANKFQLFLSKIPFIKQFRTNVSKFLTKYDSVANNIDDIALKLDETRLNLMKDNAKIDEMFKNTFNDIDDIDNLIVALDLKIEKSNIELEEMKKNELSDFEIDNLTDFIYRMEKKKFDLMGIRTSTIQSLPQIKIVQSNNISLCNQIKSAINTIIPNWRRNIAVSISLINQKRASDIMNIVNNVSNEILVKNANRLKENSINIATTNEKTIIAQETINTVQKDLIETLTAINDIKNKGTNERKIAMQKLLEINERL